MQSTIDTQAETALASPQQAADYLNISRSTIYAMLDAGELPSVKIRRARRIRWSDLYAIVETGEV